MHESSEIEQQLRRLAPARCEGLMADTFYKAGWKAAEKALATQTKPAVFRHRSARSFASGLVSGLLFAAVGVTAWQWTNRSAPQPAADIVTAASDGEESSHADVVNNGDSLAKSVEDVWSPLERVQQDQPWDSLIGTLLPWSWRPAPTFDNATPPEARPLSPAARYYWSSLVLPEQPGRSGGSVLSADRRERHHLQNFPITDAMVEELL